MEPDFISAVASALRTDCLVITETSDCEDLAECCNLCGSLGVAHFEEGEGAAQTFHRCLRCLAEFVGCNFGKMSVDSRTRLTGAQSG